MLEDLIVFRGDLIRLNDILRADMEKVSGIITSSEVIVKPNSDPKLLPGEFVFLPFTNCIAERHYKTLRDHISDNLRKYRCLKIGDDEYRMTEVFGILLNILGVITREYRSVFSFYKEYNQTLVIGTKIVGILTLVNTYSSRCVEAARQAEFAEENIFNDKDSGLIEETASDLALRLIEPYIFAEYVEKEAKNDWLAVEKEALKKGDQTLISIYEYYEKLVSAFDKNDYDGMGYVAKMLMHGLLLTSIDVKYLKPSTDADTIMIDICNVGRKIDRLCVNFNESDIDTICDDLDIIDRKLEDEFKKQ